MLFKGKVKHLLIAAVLFAAIFALVGCGDASSNNGPSNKKTETGPTFTLNDERDGYILTSYKLGDETDVVIPDTYEGLPVVEIGAHAFATGSTKLTSVLIPSTVKRIGNSAFAYCEDLKSVVIPDSVNHIGKYSFHISGLTSVTIGSGLETVDEEAFDSCYNLESVYISDLSKWCEISFTRNQSSYISSNPLYYAHNLYLNGELIEAAVIPSGVTSIKDYAFQGASFKSISIPESVTSIGDYAFLECKELADIDIANGVKSIGERAFCECRKLKSVVIPDSVLTIGEETFAYCDGLESITIPFVGDRADAKSGDKNIKSFGYIFSGHGRDDCDLVKIEEGLYYSKYYLPASLTSVTVTGGNILNGAFCGCTNVTEINCGENVKSVAKDAVDSYTGWYNTFNNGDIMYMGKILYGRKGDELENTELVVRDGTVGFANDALTDTNLTIIELPKSVKFVTGIAAKSLKKIRAQSLAQWCGYSFSSYTSPFYFNGNIYLCVRGGLLNTEWETVSGAVKFPNDVTSIGDYAFAYYNHISDLQFSDALTSIGDGAFYCCENLETVQKFGSGVKSIRNDAFRGCKKLMSVSMNEAALANWYSIKFENEYSTPLNHTNRLEAIGLFLINEDRQYGEETHFAVDKLEIPDGVTSINDYAFQYCKNLKTVTVPSSVKAIGKQAFYGCDTLSRVNLNGSVSIKEDAFRYCKKLSSVSLSKLEDWLGSSFEITNNSYGAYPFYDYTPGSTGLLPTLSINNTAITQITVPDSVTSIGDYMFYKLESLTSVTFGNGVTSIGNYAFAECRGLTSITIPDNVTKIGHRAFKNCFLTSLTIGKGVAEIGDEAFSASASSLEAITVSGDNTKYKSAGSCLIEIATGKLMLGCSSSVIPSDGSIKSIDSMAFYGYTPAEITIPVSVKEINSFAFWGTMPGVQINYEGTKAQWNQISTSTGTLHAVMAVVCTDGTITYNTAE